MRFIVYGAGAIGSIIGGHLFRTGHDAVLVANPEHVDRIRESGLKLVTPDETYVLRVPAYKEAKELTPFKDDDVVLLTAKSQHTLRCLGQLKNAGATRTLPIFCCQNSIWNEPLATRIFDRVYGVLLVMPGIFLEPGLVIHPITGNGGLLEVGLYPSGSDELAETVWAALKKAGFEGGVNKWVMKSKAAKCHGRLENAMGAITDGKGDSGEFMAEARTEAMTVWSVAGIEWEGYSPVTGVPKMPKGYEDQRNLGSSWQSLMRGTGNTEAEQLNGDIVQLGKLLGIPTPYNEVLWQVADEMAAKKEKPGKYSVNDLMEMVRKKTSAPEK
jgi:2-dehydropantoate 2-reductase